MCSVIFETRRSFAPHVPGKVIGAIAAFTIRSAAGGIANSQPSSVLSRMLAAKLKASTVPSGMSVQLAQSGVCAASGSA